MQKIFQPYRVLAYVVGVLLTLMAFVGMPMKYLLDHGTPAQEFGETLTFLVAVAHGWIYIVYVLVAFLLSRAAKWPVTDLLIMLVAGLVPVMIFFVERRVRTRLLAEHPELIPTQTA